MLLTSSLRAQIMALMAFWTGKGRQNFFLSFMSQSIIFMRFFRLYSYTACSTLAASYHISLVYVNSLSTIFLYKLPYEKLSKKFWSQLMQNN